MIETIQDHTVHPRYLGAQSQVLDLGANYGLFAKAITARLAADASPSSRRRSRSLLSAKPP